MFWKASLSSKDSSAAFVYRPFSTTSTCSVHTGEPTLHLSLCFSFTADGTCSSQAICEGTLLKGSLAPLSGDA